MDAAYSMGKKHKQRPFLYREFAGYGGQQAGWIGKWKAIRVGLHRKINRIELYDLSEDAGEKNNVAATHPDLIKQFAELFAREHSPSDLFPLRALDPKKD